MPTIQWDDEVGQRQSTEPSIQWDNAASPRAMLPPQQEETLIDKGALALDKVLRALGDATPSYLPSRQDLLDVMGGMAGMGGLLDKAPRIQNTTTDSGWKTLGKVLDPTTMAIGGKVFQAAKALPGIARMASPIAQNMAAGGAAGAAVGTLNGEPLEGAALGAVVPGGVSAAGKVLSPVTRRAKEMLDAALGPGGATRAAGRVVTDVTKEDAARVANALENGVSVETAAQAAAPVGRAELAGLERIVGSREPSVFGEVGSINQARKDFTKEAWSNLNELTGPARDAVLIAANMGRGGVPLTSKVILDSIDTVLSSPGHQTDPTVQGVLGFYREAIQKATDPVTGRINAHNLYTIRKVMGTKMQKMADEQAWDKRLVRGLAKGVDNEIDFAIEKASGLYDIGGNSKWTNYLDSFKAGAKKIEGLGERQDLAKAQASAGMKEAARIAKLDEAAPQAPGMLSRAVMVSNALLRMIGGYGGTKTTNELARLMRPENKAELAQLLRAELARRAQQAAPNDVLAADLAVQSANLGTRE